MSNYIITLSGVSTKDSHLSNLLNNCEMDLEFTPEEFAVFQKAVKVHKEKPESAEYYDMTDECMNLIYYKLDEYYAKLRKVVRLERVETPFIMFESWGMDSAMC